VAGRWVSPGHPVSSTNKSDRHDITEILLKQMTEKLSIFACGYLLKFTIYKKCMIALQNAQKIKVIVFYVNNTKYMF
jgi:hypothetical protein